MNPELLKAALAANVAAALVEDIGSGDITAGLSPADRQATARIITRDDMVMAGKLWVEATFVAVDPTLKLRWLVDEGAEVEAGSGLLEISGSARSLLTAERAALNFLQTLSATATHTRALTRLLTGTRARLLDTRKTLPGLRVAQKYAVLVGGGENHRMGLFDAFLIKENHIMAAGSIAAAVTTVATIAAFSTITAAISAAIAATVSAAIAADIAAADVIKVAATVDMAHCCCPLLPPLVLLSLLLSLLLPLVPAELPPPSTGSGAVTMIVLDCCPPMPFLRRTRTGFFECSASVTWLLSSLDR